MMRSLYSGVAGLKTHQTRMDVIGNNISNVNTIGFKASSANFADMFYQTTSPATGPDALTNAAGSNAKQIGLGSQVASITTNITEQGGTSSTNRALDIAINGDGFLVVKSGGATYFTKSGALNVDTNGTLYCTTNNATVQGWLADDQGNVNRDVVRDMTVMSPENLYYEPEATTNVRMQGNINKEDDDLVYTGSTETITSNNGKVATFSFYDNLGQLFTAKMYIVSTKNPDGTAIEGFGEVPSTVENPVDGGEAIPVTSYAVMLADICNENGESIFVTKTTDPETNVETYAATGVTVNFGGISYGVSTEEGSIDTNTGKFNLQPGVTGDGDNEIAGDQGITILSFITNSGEFSQVTHTGLGETSAYANKGISMTINVPAADADTGNAIEDTFTPYNAETDSGGVIIDFSSLTQYSSTSHVSYIKGDEEGKGTGNVAGEMKGISIDEDGFVYGSYNNGSKKCLGQIPVATFNNPSGLEAVGDSLFQESLNSGIFDGVGEEVSISGSFTVGALEMSNVDLASEFTTMITTQRGFQANSRIITTTDSMLEELVNLKR